MPDRSGIRATVLESAGGGDTKDTGRIDELTVDLAAAHEQNATLEAAVVAEVENGLADVDAETSGFGYCHER